MSHNFKSNSSPDTKKPHLLTGSSSIISSENLLHGNMVQHFHAAFEKKTPILKNPLEPNPFQAC